MAASFYSGDQVGAVVADVGHYSTKIGWAGSDTPKSYFRSNVAVSREESDGNTSGNSNSQQDDPSLAHHHSIQKANYDYFHGPIDPKSKSDGTYKVVNPVHTTTGLWYDTEPKVDGSDWNDLLPTFLTHGYKASLKADPSEHPLLLVERAYNTPAIRQQTLEVLFETVDVPATFLGKDAVLSCYGCGRTTATVVDVGSSHTTVTPVFEGFAEKANIKVSSIGVHAMDELILQQLDQLHKSPILPLYRFRQPELQRGKDIYHAARLALAQECRELGAGAAINMAPAAATATFHAPHKTFYLPDGTGVDVPSKVRFAVADLLLGDDPISVTRRQEALQAQQAELDELLQNAEAQPSDGDGADDELYSEAAAVGLSKRRTKRRSKPAAKRRFSNRPLQKACAPHWHTLRTQLTAAPLAQMVCDAAYRCDRDQQGALLGNVVLGGGGSCLGPTEQAFPETLRENIESLIHVHTPGWKVKLLAPAVAERAILSWLGGSILGSLGTFHDMWITKAEYEEWGSAIVNRKCP